MTSQNPIEHFKFLPESLKMVVGMLALVGVPTRKTRLFQYLSAAGIKSGEGKSYTNAMFGMVLRDLVEQGLIQEEVYGFRCVPTMQTPVLLALREHHDLREMCNAVEQVDKVIESYGRLYAADFDEALLHLRMTMLRQDDPPQVQRWLKKCMEMRYKHPHPYIQMFDQPFDTRLIGLLRPEVRQDVLSVLLLDTFDNPSATTPELLQAGQQSIVSSPQAPRKMVSALVENYLLRAQLDQITELVCSRSDDIAQAATSAVLLLRGDQDAALAGFEAALKTLRKETSKRTAIFDELQGILYVLALLRSKDAALRKKAKAYTEVAQRQITNGHYSCIYLGFLCQVHDGLEQAEQLKVLPKPNTPLATLVYYLVKYWLAVPRTTEESGQLAELVVQAEKLGWLFIAAQAADMLGRTENDSGARDAERAAEWFKQFTLVPMADWFERQEPWQRQLAALAGLSASGSGTVATAAQTRMVWHLNILDIRGGFQARVTPREQKRKANGGWTSGRAVAIKRLYEEIASFDFLSEQDKRACGAIHKVHGSGYYSYAEYELRHAQVLFELIGHPAVFWEDNPTIRVEVVRGEPELLIKKAGKDMLTLSLQPDLAQEEDGFVVFKETPTKVRVVQITDEHQRIGAILGKSLTLPARAKDMLLDAISAISTLITVQSDVDVLPSNIESVEADARLHLHLLPHGEGLKLHLLVRPFTDDGPYYSPGAGTETVIAEINGKPLQARRKLADEAQARQELMARCPVLAQAPVHHGETTIDDPADCLELLLQLQQQTENLVLAWPEGEKFRVSREVGATNFSMSIKRNMDWFAAEGELTIDNGQVVSLMQLLELSAQARGRFIPLGDNQFLALTEDFRRRLDDLRAFSHTASGGVRVHALASGALEELAEVAAKTKADKHWKEHLQRLRELDTLQPVLPETLQADLRDYQLTGFQWLCRLAHWGVGACLADDMGLGKTLQALALLLARAPGGPALVVAPTSVCMNWLSEAARFAPTLNVILFGAGDRGATLTDLQSFDLVVCSYGLLQNENERFSAVQWHTVVLDEAQAIKNFQTKRSQAAMALASNFRLICSGTPLENHLGELWNLFRFINPGLLGSLEHFNERYAGPIERQQDAQVRNRLRRLIQPFILRRTKTEVLSELPARTEILRQVELSAEEAALYEALRREALERLAALKDSAGGNSGQQHIQILAEIMKLRRACCNPQLVAPKLGLSSSKLAAFGELLDELLANRHKALVFSQFVDHLNLIREYLDARGVRYQYLDGATPMQERKVRVDAFQAGAGEVFLISLKAGGTGLNLTAADYVIHMDPWWNPAVEDQASDRAHRIGQTRPVTIYRLVARQTIEEKIVDLHQHKRALADSLLEGSDLAGKMSADDMLALLQEEMRAQ